jgi:regulatory protein
MDQRKPRLLDAEALWAYALRVLGGRAHSSGELRQKLARRAAQATDVDSVMARLKEARYLDDRGFAESFAAARLSGRAMGRRRVVNDLRQRRVTPALAEGAVAKVYQDVDEEALIADWVRRKYRLVPRDGLFQEDKDMASAYRRLLHAGFGAGAVVKVLKRFARNPELLDQMEAPEEEAE